MCPRRRYYLAPKTVVAAGKKERILFHKGKICVKQLNLYYNADDTTGSYKNRWIIKIDGSEVFNFSPIQIYDFFAGDQSSYNSDRPVICTLSNPDSQIYSFILHDIGLVTEGIEVWLENVDTSKFCYVRVAMAYDILE